MVSVVLRDHTQRKAVKVGAYGLNFCGQDVMTMAAARCHVLNRFNQ